MAHPALIVADATKHADGHDLLTFSCWSGDPAETYSAEVEEYIQGFALRSAFRTLTFRTDDGTLAAVSSFDKRAVHPFEAARHVVPGWHLQAVGVGRSFQGTLVASEIDGCPPEMPIADYVFRRTYQRMLEIDRQRVVVFARIHDENRRSIAACRRVGLERTVRESDDYWRMLGEVDPAIGCSG